MDTWHVTITLDMAMPDEASLHEIVRALPGGSTGRMPWSDRLRVGVAVRAREATSAAAVAEQLVWHAINGDQPGRPAGSLAVEVQRDDEFDRRLAAADARHDSGIPELYSTKQAAELLGISAAAVRMRAESGSMPARKIGDAGWVFPAAAIDTLAAAHGDGRPSRPNPLHENRRAAARQSD